MTRRTDKQQSSLWFERNKTKYKKHKIKKGLEYNTPTYKRFTKQLRMIKLMSIFNITYNGHKRNN